MDKTILAIAGSDSISGAGVQIDIKTAAAHGVYATCAITAVTAQNTLGVSAIQQVDPDVIEAQLEAVYSDIPPDAVKIGMLGSLDAAKAVERALSRHGGVPVVLDPVLVATSGSSLTATNDMLVALDLLLPHCTLLTPNVPEALALSGIGEGAQADPAEIALRLHKKGAKTVLIKGGHGIECDDPSVATDRLYDAGALMASFSMPRVAGEFHGTGCSLSTAIASNLALGFGLEPAVGRAKTFVAGMLSQNDAPASSGVKLLNPQGVAP